jgi:hypothetical protein
MSKPSPPTPTRTTVLDAAERFEQDPRSGLADRVLARVFAHHAPNLQLEDVLIKVVLLNGLYNTNVFALTDMASHIVDLDIDPELAAGSPSLVDRIASLTLHGKTRRHYSFATKYCSWHRPDQYPIYDNLVEALLWQYRREYHFADFGRPDMQDFPSYKAIIEAFIGHFQLDGISFKQVDKFLWYTAKRLEA